MKTKEIHAHFCVIVVTRPAQHGPATTTKGRPVMKNDKPTLTSGIPRGVETQTLLALQKQGVSIADYAAIGTNFALRVEIVATLMKHRLFATPEEQMTSLLRINEQVWKDPTITMAAMKAIGDPPPCPMLDEIHLYCVVLLSETGDPIRTFARNWAACEFVHSGNTWKYDGLVFTPQIVRVREKAIPRPVGLRWAIAELGRTYLYDDKIPDVLAELDRTQTMVMGQELPLIAALHPKWVTQMNTTDIPPVFAPDLEVSLIGESHYDHRPLLFFRNRGDGVGLIPDLIGRTNDGYSFGFFR
ncbi:MAG: hypothetical protein WCV85_02050 [Patescibacteria group bacterium]